MKENVIVEEDLQYFVNHIPFVEDLKGKTFLVTGSTGLIGSIFIKCILALNVQNNARINILALARNPKKVKSVFGNVPVKWIFQDISETLSIFDEHVDYIVHCANSTSSKFYVEHPVENINTAYIGTNNILEYARTHFVKSIVYLSSLESYGSIHNDIEITEDMGGFISPTDVRSSYSLGKRAVECLCHCYAKEYGVPVKIARLTQTFGAGISLHDSRVFAQFAKSIISGKDIKLHTKGESAKPYCYVTDAISAILYLLFKGIDGEVYNVANSNTYISICDMAQLVIDNFNSTCSLVIDIKDDMGYAPVTRLNLNTNKLKALGWKPHYDLKNMYERLIKYYKTKG